MKNKYFIENRFAMNIVDGVNELTRIYYPIEKVKDDLNTQLKMCRIYKTTYRNGGYDYLIDLPCGYQDSHFEAAQGMFDKLEVLKVLYRVKQGDMTRLTYWYDNAIGRN